MKFLNFKKIILTFAFIFFIQNSTIIISEMLEASYSDGELVSPCSDVPPSDVRID